MTTGFPSFLRSAKLTKSDALGFDYSAFDRSAAITLPRCLFRFVGRWQKFLALAREIQSSFVCKRSRPVFALAHQPDHCGRVHRGAGSPDERAGGHRATAVEADSLPTASCGGRPFPDDANVDGVQATPAGVTLAAVSLVTS